MTQVEWTSALSKIRRILGTTDVSWLDTQDRILISLRFFGSRPDLEFFLKTVRGLLDHAYQSQDWSIVARRWRWRWLKIIGYPADKISMQKRGL